MGYGGRLVHLCQVDGCEGIAWHQVSRGIGMPHMYMCDKHMLEFREIVDNDAFAISAARRERRSYRIALGSLHEAL